MKYGEGQRDLHVVRVISMHKHAILIREVID